ncbi:hypothetical protein KZJ38_26795 [Paraburkholderia edwinii]|uniref:Uncharacterized protein n=1 Tax=Paraburkholderia edwinii TaxID=2861782 RepID=A0ABX8UY97_9BURK|nr:hypothetical protein [Paraburkholderia edwinii]QYD73252.1 hypothetical protein KZJ38_26795 [Paraburkholderia edwinii]
MSVPLDMSALVTLLTVVVVMNSRLDPIRLVAFGLAARGGGNHCLSRSRGALKR